MDSKHNAISWWCLKWRWGLSAQMGHTWEMNPNLTSLLSESIFLLCIVAIAQLKPLMLHLKINSFNSTYKHGKNTCYFQKAWDLSEKQMICSRDYKRIIHGVICWKEYIWQAENAFMELYPQGNLSCSSEYGWFLLGSMYFAEILTLLLFCSVFFQFFKKIQHDQ